MVDTSNMDIVYVVGGSSIKNNFEDLKWSLRSLSNIKFRHLFIFTDKIGWLKTQHIVKAPDIGSTKHIKVINKLKKICQSSFISDDFVYMNDDFIFTKPHTLKKRYRLESIKSVMQGSGVLYNQVLDQSLNTLRNSGFQHNNYELHYPMIFNRKNLKNVLDIYVRNKNTCYRSIYGNIFVDKEYEPMETDPKAFDEQSFFKFSDEFGFVSTNDNIINSDKIRCFLKDTFPNKSIYEQ